MAGDRFASDQSIERYRRLACAATTGEDRMRLLGLLAEEEDKYIDLQKPVVPRIMMATKERLAAMAASLCAVCSGSMVATRVEANPNDVASELRTYVCAECGHSRTYSVTAEGS
jgi:hypothetical protein